ncbi:MAG: SDR family oxidoreductase [Chloroherpetonaceae bacterium]|nr:SDR family oxidoreductase [Chloroherpetonaceae bacterium]MDW8436627.1 SDR family oxidoreductase [Chloroherpetonaceae bacterium]
MTTLITGASTGIGACFADAYARRKHNLVLVARSEDKLNALAKRLSEANGIDALVFAQDLSKPDSAEKVLAFCDEKKLDVDLLINNAGFGMMGEFLSHDLSRLEQMVTLNALTLMKLSRLFAERFARKRSGGIINVASTAAFQPVPQMAVYAATKAFALSFSEAIAFELKEKGVRVMALCPGGTDTPFFDNANYERSKLMIPLEKPEDVVRTCIEAYERGESVVVSGFMNKLMVNSSRFAPRSLVTAIAGSIFKK